MEIAYRCCVPVGGYEIREEPVRPLGRTVDSPPVLARSIVPRNAEAPHKEEPLPADLFRKFAALSHAEKALLEFSNKYGVPDYSAYLEGEPEGSSVPVCPLNAMRWAVDTLHYACRAWDDLRGGYVNERVMDALADLSVSRTGAAFADYDLWTGGTPSHSPDDEEFRKSMSKQWRAQIGRVVALETGSSPSEPDPLTFARATLAHELNLHLGGCCLQFIWPDKHPRRRFLVADPTGATTEDPSAVDDGPVLMWQARSLIDALWAQLALAVDSRLEYRQCAWPGCPNWFPVGIDQSRSHREYCGDTCRKRAARARQRR